MHDCGDVHRNRDIVTFNNIEAKGPGVSLGQIQTNNICPNNIILTDPANLNLLICENNPNHRQTQYNRWLDTNIYYYKYLNSISLPLSDEIHKSC